MADNPSMSCMRATVEARGGEGVIHLRNWLIVTLLALCCDVAWKASITLDRASTAISELSSTIQGVHQVIAKVGPQVEGAAAEQRRYYKATGKALAITTIKLGRTAEEAQALLADARHAVQTLDREVAKNGEASQKAITEAQDGLAAARGSIANLTSALAPVGAIARNLEQVSAEAVDGSRAGAQAAGSIQATAAHLESAARSVDEALKPLRTTGGKMKAVLRWLLNVVKVNIR